ncbi:SMP-30/gluconolactonase/LRE family protein [Microbulbifer sp.]|uniref:SMP-30/gluconolactonase/LRE family protein n=1 Tax=Microbulbifer sp. TaxID=1908541 RepID=UPI003F3AE6E6
MADVEVVANLHNELGEGPLWCAREQVLYWVDIKKELLFRFSPCDGHVKEWSIGMAVAAVTTTDMPGRLLLACRGGLYRFDVATGTSTELLCYEQELPDNRPNDGKTDPNGRFWFGTTDDLEQAVSGSLYRLNGCMDGAGQLQKISGNIGNPNTFAWSPDRKTFYSADSVEQTMFAYDFDNAKGEISNKRVFFTLKGTHIIPDGSTVDAEGYLWNAQWMGWRVVRYAPDGSIDRIVEMPVACPTSCMFGGEDLKTLYVTSARKDQTEEALLKQPYAGALFAIKCEVPGLPESAFIMKQQVRLNAGLAGEKNGLTYSRDSLDYGIVHLGIGAFHRAHEAAYTDKLMAQQGGDWKIIGVSLRSAGVRDQLNPQNGLYTLVEMDGESINRHVIGAVSQVLVAPEDPGAVLEAMVSERCKIISLTITEKGYCLLPASGLLNERHPGIVHDLADPERPETAIGFIVEALRRRRAARASIPTILCCDNLPNNGSTLKQIVVGFARLRDAGLGDWIEANVSFPNTMVDRIVPATREEDIAQLQQDCDYLDLGLVKTEAFSQWVIEDEFTAGRPDWNKVGANFVRDVAPFELAKLRLLNGTHSTLAYLGYLAGYEYVHQVLADPEFARFLRGLMEKEIAPTLTAPEGMDLNDYVDALLTRFANANLQHRTYQIAMDGSQKLPQRLLGTLRDRLACGGSIEHLSLAIAGWIRYVMAFDQRGDPIDVQDPMAGRLERVARDSEDKSGRLVNVDTLVAGYLAISDIFGEDLAENRHFSERVTYWLSHILANGVGTTIKIFSVSEKCAA